MTTDKMHAEFETWWESVGAPSPYAVWQAATLAEREACAKVCDDVSRIQGSAETCAHVIRKGEAP